MKVREYAKRLLFDQRGFWPIIGAIIGAITTVGSSIIQARGAEEAAGTASKYGAYLALMTKKADQDQELTLADKRIEEEKSRVDFLKLQYAGGQVGSMPYPYVKITGQDGTAAFLPLLIGAGILMLALKGKRQ